MLSRGNILVLSYSQQELNSQHKMAWNGNVYFWKFSIVQLFSTLHFFKKNPGVFSSASQEKHICCMKRLAAAVLGDGTGSDGLAGAHSSGVIWKGVSLACI